MLLFQNNLSPNLLPKDGEVVYHSGILSLENAKSFFIKLSEEIDWKNDEVVLYGKRMVTKRKVAWYGDNPFNYKYSGVVRTAQFWTRSLIELKKITEEITGVTFNSCLLNLYHNGSEGMSWHADDEKMLEPEGEIASLSLGATRKFSFKHKKTKETIDITLENGSLLIMKGSTQSNWLHSLPKSTKVKSPRINLTFRTIIES